MTATGTAYNLNASNLELFAVVPNHTIKIDDFSVAGNVVTWTFLGTDQKFTGPYTLTLIENRGQSTMMTVDYCNAFGLVRWSCQAGWDESADVNSNLSLTSEIFTHQIALSKEVQAVIDGNITEYNVSNHFPTGGIDGTNRYTLATAIAKIPESLRSVGIKCSFINEAWQVETWEYQGGTYLSVSSWIRSDISAVNEKIDNQKAEVDAAKDEAMSAIDNREQEVINNFNAQRVTPEMLSEATKQLINSSGGGTINNLPDDEDITSTGGDTPVLKFKDRKPDHGKGYVILRRNKTFAEQVTQANTIYEIRYDFDLDGGTVSLPDNCVLNFNGGSIYNGVICFNNTFFINPKFSSIINMSGTVTNRQLFARDFSFNHDTDLLKFLLIMAGYGIIIELESRTYNINSTGDVEHNYDDSFVSYENTNGITIHGNNATIVDNASKTVLGALVFSLMKFISCSYVTIDNITYRWAYEAQLDPEVEGICFIRTISECSNFNISCHVENAGRCIYAGEWNQTKKDVGRGFCDSTIRIYTHKVGYPFNVEKGDNIDLTNMFDTCHRGTYLAGVTNSKVVIKGKDAINTNCLCLLTDTVDINGWYCCDNIDAYITDTGSSKYDTATMLAVYQFYGASKSQFASRDIKYNATINLHLRQSRATVTPVEMFRFSAESQTDDNIVVNMETCFVKNISGNVLFRTNSLPLARVNIMANNDNDEITNVIIVPDNTLRKGNSLSIRNAKRLNINIGAQSQANCGELLFDNCSFYSLITSEEGFAPRVIFKNISEYNSIRFNNIEAYENSEAVNYAVDQDRIHLSRHSIMNLSKDTTLKYYVTPPLNSIYFITCNNISSQLIRLTLQGNLIGETDKYVYIAPNSSVVLIQVNFNGVRKYIALRPNNYRSYGASKNRPTEALIGDVYFDQSLLKPIWWTGSKWVDATGTEA